MEWMKIEEKEPTEHEWILGTDGEAIDMGIWMVPGGFSLPDLNYLRRPITHWMPLPELPKDD